MSNNTDENIQKVNILDVSDKAVDNLLKEVNKTIHGGIDLGKVQNMTVEEVKELDAKRDKKLQDSMDATSVSSKGLVKEIRDRIAEDSTEDSLDKVYKSFDDIDEELNAYYDIDTAEYKIIQAYFLMWDYDRRVCREVLSSTLLRRELTKTNLFEAEYMAFMTNLSKV
jgi:hypothetical protein